MKLRKNRLGLLALVGVVAYIIYNETQKDSKLKQSAKDHWSHAKDAANRMATETRKKTDQFIAEVEGGAHDMAEDAWETVEGVKDAAQETIQNAQDKAQEVAHDLKGSEENIRDDYYRPENMNR